MHGKYKLCCQIQAQRQDADLKITHLQWELSSQQTAAVNQGLVPVDRCANPSQHPTFDEPHNPGHRVGISRPHKFVAADLLKAHSANGQLELDQAMAKHAECAPSDWNKDTALASSSLGESGDSTLPPVSVALAGPEVLEPCVGSLGLAKDIATKWQL